MIWMSVRDLFNLLNFYFFIFISNFVALYAHRETKVAELVGLGWYHTLPQVSSTCWSVHHYHLRRGTLIP